LIVHVIASFTIPMVLFSDEVPKYNVTLFHRLKTGMIVNHDDFLCNSMVKEKCQCFQDIKHFRLPTSHNFPNLASFPCLRDF